MSDKPSTHLTMEETTQAWRLHIALDMLVAQYCVKTQKMPSMTTVMDLMMWNHERIKALGHPEFKSETAGV